jgi:hypothetical protein
MTPNQMRYLCTRSELEDYVSKRLSSLNKRSIDAWNSRNEAASRSQVNLGNITHETLVYIASALNKAERASASQRTVSGSVSEDSSSEE